MLEFRVKVEKLGGSSMGGLIRRQFLRAGVPATVDLANAQLYRGLMYQ